MIRRVRGPVKLLAGTGHREFAAARARDSSDLVAVAPQIHIWRVQGETRTSDGKSSALPQICAPSQRGVRALSLVGD